MLKLPYRDKQFDCIYCRNVISHTDTEGMKQIIKELNRTLKQNGECYLTLGSKDTWGFKQEDWPLVDENTRMRMEKGPEYKVPHFYADYNLIKKLFKTFEILDIHQEIDYYEKVWIKCLSNSTKRLVISTLGLLLYEYFLFIIKNERRIV